MVATLFGTRETRSPLDPPLPAKEARKAILSGSAPAGLRIRGHLDLSKEKGLTALPEGLTAGSLDVSGCVNLRSLPANLRATRILLNGCTALEQLPSGVTCFEMEAKGSGLRSLPADIRVENRLDLTDCAALEELPEGLKVGSLILQNCAALTSLPEGLDVYFLDLTNCAGLCRWPEKAAVRIGRLIARGCAGITGLPPYLTNLAQLDLSGCASLTRLPEGLRVSSWLDIADTGITVLPASLKGVRLRWKGVLVDERIVFDPEGITGQEVLAAPNAEVRRVMMERMGYERFLREVQAEVLDRDADPGGERRLLRVPLRGDEDVVGLSVFCPSTGRRYILRVPPTMRTCRQAAAWIAGFDDPDDYRPLAET